MLAFMTLKPNTCQAVISRTRPLAGRTNGLSAERFAPGCCERACMGRPPDPSPEQQSPGRLFVRLPGTLACVCWIRARAVPAPYHGGGDGTAWRQVFWLAGSSLRRTFPPASRQWRCSAAFVPGHSGGSATALHRLPSRPLMGISVVDVSGACGASSIDPCVLLCGLLELGETRAGGRPPALSGSPR